jgi:DNA-binding protein HU-beta
MNRIELARKVAAAHDLSQAEAERVLKTIVETIVTTVKKRGEVGIVGFGTFKQVKRAARKGRNPATGESVKVRAKRLPKFVPGAPFKALVAGDAGKAK